MPPSEQAPASGKSAHQTASVLQPRKRQFNRNILDRSDPLDFAGSPQSDFSLTVSYPVTNVDHEDLIALLFNRVIEKIEHGAIPDATTKLFDFDDVKTGTREQPRRYLVIQKETSRQIRMSTYVTFLSYGEHIYSSVDSFVLGPLNIWSAILGPLGYIASFAALSRSSAVIVIPIGIALGGWLLSSAFYELAQGESLKHVLRKRFYRESNLGSFSVDDMLMFFKSANPIVLRSIHEVFGEHDIPTDVIDAALLRSNTTTTIAKRGSIVSLINSIVGDLANRKIS